MKSNLIQGLTYHEINRSAASEDFTSVVTDGSVVYKLAWNGRVVPVDFATNDEGEVARDGIVGIRSVTD